MNPLLRKQFQDRFAGRLDPQIVHVFHPATGWSEAQSVRPTPQVLRGFQAHGFTHVGVAPSLRVQTIADFSIRELLAADRDEYGVKRNGRKALTPNQRRLLDILMHRSKREDGSFVVIPATMMGSRGGMRHLVVKGYVAETVSYGPRGGARYAYTPIP